MIDLAHHRFQGGSVDLGDVPTTPPSSLDKATAVEETARLTSELATLQERFYADGRHRLLVVLQAIDTGGKDGTIRRVFGPLNPHGVRVVPFKAPSSRELDHDYLWRVHSEVPGNGEIVIFNRSHYEDVLVVRVHDLVPKHRWEKRYGHIRAFEDLLIDEGTTVVKLFLHISKDEQKERLQSRLDDPTKRWKFAAADLEERKFWDDYRAAYEAMIEETGTKQAPWHVVPADKKWYRDLVVASIVHHAISSLDLEYPAGPDDPAGIVID